MGKFSPRSSAPPPPPPPPPAPAIQPAATKATENTRAVQAQKKGQAAAVVTGGQGLLTEAPTQKPRLLGQNKMGN
mgnify:CR=1 FL=1|tara:strand:- start:220 stop:444 length:225 start_codon:yes stop_codon:yes gene_type:complete